MIWELPEGAPAAAQHGRCAKDAEPQLFDLNSDISEAKDIVREKPDVVARLQKAHDVWNTELIPPFFESPKPAAKKKSKQAGRAR